MAIESKPPVDKDHKTSYKSSKILKTTSSNSKPLVDIIVGVDSYATKYKELQKIGEGSYSIVMKSRNRATSIKVAVKKLKHCYRNKDQVEEIPEVKTLRRLPAHPNILQMLETHFDPNAGRVCLIFELMEMNLYELIKDRKKLLGENRVRGMIFQLMRGLRHLHKYGIFHRDVKPENILVQTKHGADALKLADLGSVRAIYSNPPYTEYISTRWYRSPECLLTSGRYTAKMDIWAAGCVFYEILTLRPLFPGSSEIDQITRIHNVLGVPSERVLEKLSHWARQDDGSYSSARQLKQSRFEAIKGVLNGLRNGTLVSNGNKKSPFSKILPSQISPAAQDLLKVMLHYDPDGRPSSHRILQNEYFKELKIRTKAADAKTESNQMMEAPKKTQKTSEVSGPKLPVSVLPPIHNNSNVTSFSKNPTVASTTTGKKPSDIKLKEIRSRNQLKDGINTRKTKPDETPKLSVKNSTNKNSSYFTVKIYKDESISSANSLLPKLLDEDTKLQLLVQARRRNSKNLPAGDQLKPTPSLNLYSKTQKPISLDIKNNNGNSSGYMTRFNLQQQRIHKADENCNYLNAPLQPKLSLKEKTQSLLKKNERGMPEPTTLKIRGQNSNVAIGRLLREADMRRRSEQIELENQLTNKSSKNKLLEKSNARVNYMPVNPFSKEGYYFSSDEDVVSLMRQKFDNLIIQRANDKSKERQEQMKRMESDEEIKSFKSRLEKSRKLLRRSNDAELPMPVVEKKVTIPSTKSYFQQPKAYKDSLIDSTTRYHLQQPRKYPDATKLQNCNLEMTPKKVSNNSQFHYSPSPLRAPLKQLSNTKTTTTKIAYHGLKDEKETPLKKDTKYFDTVAKMRHQFDNLITTTQQQKQQQQQTSSKMRNKERDKKVQQQLDSEVDVNKYRIRIQKSPKKLRRPYEPPTPVSLEKELLQGRIYTKYKRPLGMEEVSSTKLVQPPRERVPKYDPPTPNTNTTKLQAKNSGFGHKLLSNVQFNHRLSPQLPYSSQYSSLSSSIAPTTRTQNMYGGVKNVKRSPLKQGPKYFNSSTHKGRTGYH